MEAKPTENSNTGRHASVFAKADWVTGPLACVLFALAFAAAFILAAPQDAAAAEAGQDPVNIRSYEIEGGYVEVNSGVGYITENGDISYCYDFTAHGPGRAGQDYTDADEGTYATDYILAMGYPYTTAIAGTEWSAAEAQAITQLAAWLVSGTADESRGSFVTASEEILDAAYAFAAEAQAYQGGDPSIDGCSSILYVSGDPSVQAMLTARVGGYVSLVKTSANASVTLGNDEYSLAGAVYGVFSADGVQVSQLVTDADGFAVTERRLSPGGYIVRELSASSGYVLSDAEYCVEVGTEDVTVEDEETPITVRLVLVKKDAETGESAPQGSAALDGAEYEVAYLYDGQRTVASGTIEDGKAVFGSIPLGTIEVRESKAPDGYLLDEETYVVEATAEAAGHESPVMELEVGDGLCEQVMRGDLELVKVSGSTGEKLAGVPFTVTSKTTGESHTIVTDAKGYASTAACSVLHTQDTNGGTAGSCVWFGGGEVDDAKGALPYDTYVVEEQRCEANAGLKIVPAFEVDVFEDGVTVDLGTLVDEAEGKVVPVDDNGDEGESGSSPTAAKTRSGVTVKTQDSFPLHAVIGAAALAGAVAVAAVAISRIKADR